MSALAITTTMSSQWLRNQQAKTDKQLSYRFRMITVAEFEQAWSYVNKIASIFRNSINCAARVSRVVRLLGQNFPHHVKNVTSYMKLLSIVGVPFAMRDLVTTAKKIYSSVLLNDKEGLALSLLSFSILSLDAYDSLTTFVNSALTIASFKPVAAFSVVALPVAFAMSGMGIVSRAIQITKAGLLYRSIQRDLLKDTKFQDKKILLDFLEAKLGTEELKLVHSLLKEGPQQATLEEVNQLKVRKKAALLRVLPSGSVEELEKLFDKFKIDTAVPLTKVELNEIVQSFEKIQRQLSKKMTLDALAIVSSLVIITALTLFALEAAAALAFLLLAVAFSIRLGANLYQDLKKIN